MDDKGMHGVCLYENKEAQRLVRPLSHQQRLHDNTEALDTKPHNPIEYLHQELPKCVSAANTGFSTVFGPHQLKLVGCRPVCESEIAG
jgi:hypothetical protein